MKKIKVLLSVLLIAALLAAMSGCYVIRGQKMDKVKGTYKLTNYTYTPSYERREGYTPDRRDYINDEKYQYEDYLIITGSGSGYYVHKEVGAPAFVREVTLSYEYSQEDSSKVEYVVWNDAISKNQTSDIYRLGVNGKSLNHSIAAFDYTQLFTKKQMRSEDLYVRWEKVDNATDLSYAQKQLGTLKEYDYEGYGVRGIYELWSSTDMETGTLVESKFQYFYYVIDTAKGTTTAKVYYALKETPTQQVEKTVPFSGDGEWATMTIDGAIWYVDPDWGTYYYNESEGLKHQIICVSSDILDARVQELIAGRLPTVTE
ncbi:MAG: hypothetical protein E7435_05520 [Ruminococcaceae bacterium]|nr:hypothetical protein [Oscillospiraceae bacterium]